MTQVTEVKDNSELQREFDKMTKKLAKMLNGPYVTNVGVLGSSSSRPDGAIDNAGIGLVMEFGRVTKEPKIPARSWLRMPIIHKRDMILKAVVNKQRNIENAFNKEDDKIIFEILGLACESAIQEAFDSNGFGSWEANSPVTIELKGSATPLIDTGEFRQSVMSAVKRK